MSNVLSNEKRQQVVALGRLGWSLRRIEAETGVRRETASAYLGVAGVLVRPSGGRYSVWPPKPAATVEVSTDSGLGDGVLFRAKPATTERVSTDFAGPLRPPLGPARPLPSTCEPYREVIETAVTRGRNAMAIWQDLVDDHGFRSGYSSVKRYVAKLCGSAPLEARGVIRTEPGEEAQVDYGDGPTVRDRVSGKYRRTRLFVLTLGYSRKSIRLLCWKSSTQIWSELHEQAFRRLGGAPRVIVLDNLREGVIAPDIYDPTVNPLYRDVLCHYGAIALPCRVRNPKPQGQGRIGCRSRQEDTAAWDALRNPR